MWVWRVAVLLSSGPEPAEDEVDVLEKLDLRKTRIIGNSREGHTLRRKRAQRSLRQVRGLLYLIKGRAETGNSKSLQKGKQIEE